MLKKLLLSLLVAVPVVAQADWMEWGKDDEFVTYIDPDRTVKTYETLEQAEVWLKMVVHTDLSKDGLSVGDHRLVKYGVKCRTNELGLLAYYAYKKTKLIDSYVFRSPQYEPVIPDSKGERILYVVCAALYGQEES
ncbi:MULTISPECIES: surface-adhesin E family protein [unclassified Acinetobacter]|uniref:surface-adhesin E family protein n=1 Tax=unclassified Acinetobacter TaxID=196816 RepID=UPI0015D1DB46|nr:MULTISPECIES: surface-adhesin E family protein [unclassified Acinetobacter]